MATKQSVTTREGDRIAIVAGLRTPFAKMATYFHGVPAVDLGKMVVNELLVRHGIKKSGLTKWYTAKSCKCQRPPTLLVKLFWAQA